MTTFDPDTLEQDVDVLRDIRQRFNGLLALNANVAGPGIVRIDDPVRLLDPDETNTLMREQSITLARDRALDL